MTHDDNTPQLSWGLILILLAGTGTAAWLTLVEGWSMEASFGVVALGMGGLMLCVRLLLVIMTPSREWSDLKTIIWLTVRDDARALWNVLHLPRRRK